MQATERAFQEEYEKFVQQGIERWHRQREAKERKEKEAEKSAETGDRP
jgi:chloramphenicol O-acetyltransferase